MIKKLSEAGKYHKETGEENQDVLCCAQNKKYSVISLADGVSTCQEAKKGAEIACRAITELFFKNADHLLEFDNEQIAELALSHILFELKRQAEANFKDLTDYSSTIASVLIDKKKKRMLCFNLGDSIIIATGKGKCRVLSMPSDSSSGCCTTTTTGASSMASVNIFYTDGLESVVLCSDGAWKQMFNKNRLKPEVFSMLSNNDYDRLKDFLLGQKCFDDYSFISMDIKQINRRKSA